MKELYTRTSSGRYKVADAAVICQVAAAHLKPERGQAIRSPMDTEDFLKVHFAKLQHEVFAAIFLDNRHRVIEFRVLFRGTIDGTSVYPREVVKETLELNAAALILAHNHPSGIPEPSQADERITILGRVIGKYQDFTHA